MNTFTKTEVFLSVFVQKQSEVNGALVKLENTKAVISEITFSLGMGMQSDDIFILRVRKSLGVGRERRDGRNIQVTQTLDT